QSYFLHRLNQQQLSRTLFPLASHLKRDVRALAERLALPNHAKKDSTGICFIGERPFRAFLSRYMPTDPGDMVTPDGAVVGRHGGLMYYTIGQRQGLGIGGQGLPWYVAGKDLDANRLTVVQGHDHPALSAPALEASDLAWVAGRSPAADRPYAAKTRYRQPDAACRIDADAAGRLRVRFDAPHWAIAPGQSVVLYDGPVCLGGGIIERSLDAGTLRAAA
ncbi:MAG: tRNA 2-thiouridine(34) synthase MnmA, partial [Burkholderiales bacterium]|nr:tRNA 2-thiouridine(34) synthase MnmA [Burkholderiales bacterium]